MMLYYAKLYYTTSWYTGFGEHAAAPLGGRGAERALRVSPGWGQGPAYNPLRLHKQRHNYISYNTF